MRKTLRIGTRGSALALWQANHVAALLRAAVEGLEVELLTIKTKGDKIQDVPLAKVGGKGLFVKEIELALQRGEVDLAVHSMKDVPAELLEGMVLAAIPGREDPRDALVCAEGGQASSFDTLPRGAVLGTSSLRRRCQALHLRPDLQVRDLRGNVGTRLAKLDRGDFDAVVLAAAGLKRLELEERVSEFLPPERMVPAVGQGALGIEIRADDRDAAAAVALLHDPLTATRVRAERALLACLGGGCQVPVAGHATFVAGGQGTLHLDALVGHPSGQPMYRQQLQGEAARPEALGETLGKRLLNAGAKAVLDEVYG